MMHSDKSWTTSDAFCWRWSLQALNIHVVSIAVLRPCCRRLLRWPYRRALVPRCSVSGHKFTAAAETPLLRQPHLWYGAVMTAGGRAGGAAGARPGRKRFNGGRNLATPSRVPATQLESYTVPDWVTGALPDRPARPGLSLDVRFQRAFRQDWLPVTTTAGWLERFR